MPKSLYTVLTLVRINTKRFFRDRLAIFFTIIFPLIFLFVFGGLNSGNNDVSFRVALVNQSDSAFAKDFVKQAKESKILEVDPEVTTLDAGLLDRDAGSVVVRFPGRDHVPEGVLFFIDGVAVNSAPVPGDEACRLLDGVPQHQVSGIEQPADEG